MVGEIQLQIVRTDVRTGDHTRTGILLMRSRLGPRRPSGVGVGLRTRYYPRQTLDLAVFKFFNAKY